MADAWSSRPAARTDRSTLSEALLVMAALAVTAYVIVYPFTQARYPPLTDLPFHAAQASILRHYFDPSFHFREQFTVHPLEAPYVSMYAIGALLAFVLPITTATKAMSIAMLLLVPAGLAVLLAGMKKDPLWAVLGLGLTWCTVSQWGFLSYMGATGLLAMSAGFSLMVVDAPTLRRRVLLSVTVVAIFFTHVYRLPFAVAAALFAGFVMYPVTRRFSVLLAPLAPGTCLFVLWLFIRPRSLSPKLEGVRIHPGRVANVIEHLFGSYLPSEGFPPTPQGTEERGLALWMFALIALSVVAALVLRAAERRREPASRAGGWTRRVNVFALLCATGLFGLYLTLPLQVGQWFYVYPREIVGVAIFLLSAVPDLPKRPLARGALVATLALAVMPMASFVARRSREFDRATMDFRQVVAKMPKAPRLLYLVYTFAGSAKRASPFVHLPAWIQAEKGGALAFHFAEWGFYPVRYREGSPDVPPPFAPGFEWNPQYFDVTKHGRWFDTFLVRHELDPQSLFDPDKTIHRVARYGTWWVYRRDPAGLPEHPVEP